MPIAPYAGSMDMVLLMLQRMALSSAMSAEIAAYKSVLSIPQSLVYTIEDANGVRQTIDLAPADLPSLAYVANSFAAVRISNHGKLLGPYPVLDILGMPGHLQTGDNGRTFRGDAYEGEVYRIDAEVWAASSDDPARLQQEAVILATCFKTLVRRNEHLGGLVQLIQPTQPVEALGGGVTDGTTVRGSRVRFEVLVLLP